MHKLLVHLAQSTPHAMVEELLVNLYPSIQFLEKDGTYTVFSIDINDTIELPLDDLYDLLVTDFEMRFILVHHPMQARPLAGETIKKGMNGLQSGTYAFEEALFELFKTHPKSLKAMKEKLFERLNQNDIVTFKAFGNANMKASNAAKRLFIHRNTMQYRLDHIQEVTGIDVKTFKGLFIVHALQTL
ncbi:MAG: helix-turn-helix domain-containing protein [Bacillota bacterium]